MTITITAGHSGATDFFAYLDAFDDSFTASGRGVFSNTFSGDYAIADAAITDTANMFSQGVIMGDAVAYDLNTHSLSGTINEIQFGYGATATETNGQTDLTLAKVDFTVSFSPDLDDPDAVNDIIYGVLGYADPGDGATDALVALMLEEDIIFVGNTGKDIFAAFNGDDTLKGKDGADTLSGGDGDDLIKGGAGKDTLDGGTGDDEVNGGDGADEITGGKGKDSLSGGKGADTLIGRAGGDEIKGGNGGDIIEAGGGNDVVSGGGGGDWIDAGAGTNIVTGNKGTDTFVFSVDFKTTTITDFKSGKEWIDLSGFDEVTDFASLLAAMTDTADGATYDLDGDGANVIVLTGVSVDDLSASDFLF